MVHLSEKQFYLRVFRRRAFVFHLAPDYAPQDVADPVAELTANETGVVLVSGHETASSVRVSFGRQLCSRDEVDLVKLTEAFLRHGVVTVCRPGRLGPGRSLAFACRLAIRLEVSKLVVVDPRGGIETARGLRSFVTAAQLSRWSKSRPDRRWSSAELRHLVEAVRTGVESVNLASAEDLPAELFTYEGAGTLVSRNAYCAVERLRLEDFGQALGLLERGEREGFLLRRSLEQRARLLLSGFGAWFDGRRLAGVASLESSAYRRQRMAEIAGLYTITRFHGEGVGVELVRALARQAQRDGCRALFACTANERAAEFFARNGFVRTDRSVIPTGKWRGRQGPDPAVFLLELGRLG